MINRRIDQNLAKLTQTLELVNKNTQTIVITIFQLFQILCRDIKGIKKTQIKLLHMIITVCKMKKKPDGINTDKTLKKRLMNLKTSELCTMKHREENNKESTSELWENFKKPSIKKQKKGGTEKYLKKILAEISLLS